MEIRSESLSDFNLIPHSELSVGTETPSNRVTQAGGFFWSKSTPNAICQKAIKAAMEQKHDVVDFLVMEGCLPDYAEVDENKNTLLHHIGGDYSNFDRYPAIVDKILKDSNVKGFIDIQNVDGNTPLHIAAIAGNTDLARKLHEAGASLDIKNTGGFQVAALTVDSEMQTEAKPTARGSANATTESIKEMVDKYIESPKKTASVGGSSVNTEKFLNELATKYAKQTGGNGCDCDCCDHAGVPKEKIITGGADLESSDLIPPFMINDKNLTTTQVQQLGFSKEQLLKSGISEKRANELLPGKREAEPEDRSKPEYKESIGKLAGGADICDCECDCHYREVPARQIAQSTTGVQPSTSNTQASKQLLPNVPPFQVDMEFQQLLEAMKGSHEQQVKALERATELNFDDVSVQRLLDAQRRTQEQREGAVHNIKPGDLTPFFLCMFRKFGERPYYRVGGFTEGDMVADWKSSTADKDVVGKIVGFKEPGSNNETYYVKFGDDDDTHEKAYKFIVPIAEYQAAKDECMRTMRGGGDDPNMTETFLSGLLVQLNGGARQSNKVKGTRKLNLTSEGAHDGDRHNQLARMMANQSNEIHKQVLEKIIKFLPKLDKKYAKLDEKELDDVGRNYKAVLWQIVKQNKELVSNLDQSNKLLELTTLKELKNINPEDGKNLREESRKRREERQKDKKPKREPKDAPKANEGDYDLSDTSSDFVPQRGGGYSQTSFSIGMLTE